MKPISSARATRLLAAVAVAIAFAVAASPAAQAADDASLSISSMFDPVPGGGEPLAGRSLLLLRESFEAHLRRAGTFAGSPDKPYTGSPLIPWAYACRNAMPVCDQALIDARDLLVTSAKCDERGNAIFPAVAPGTYYLFGRTMAGERHLVWDLRLLLQAGANPVLLTARNAARIDEDAPSAPSAASGAPSGSSSGPSSAAGDSPCAVSETARPARSSAPATSTLAVSGGGYVYTYKRTERETGAVVDSFTEHGNFSNATLYLLDEDADVILANAGVQPGIAQSRFGTLSLMAGMAALDDGGIDKIAPGMSELLSMFGGEQVTAELEDMGKAARADFECAMKAIRAHSLGQITTDAKGKGVFPAVPPGTYYVFGHFFRVREPTHSGGLVWNKPVRLVAGRNTTVLTVDDTVYRQP